MLLLMNQIFRLQRIIEYMNLILIFNEFNIDTYFLLWSKYLISPRAVRYYSRINLSVFAKYDIILINIEKGSLNLLIRLKETFAIADRRNT